MAVNQFGSLHTDEKLGHLEEYLRTFTTALKKQPFKRVFFDAFAGTGDIKNTEDTPLLETVSEYSAFIRGSAQRALSLGTAFDEYVFVEKRRAKAAELEKLRTQYPDVADRIVIQNADANAALINFCTTTDWKRTRAVVFLDPFGNQVSWSTLEVVAATKAIDLWYLFPAGLGVHRQISREGKVHQTHELSLDNLLGTKEWRTEFIRKERTADLFGDAEREVKQATAESITEFMASRMGTIFKGGVLEEWLPLGSRGIHMYSLMFAWANPDPKARLAGRLARAVLGRKRRGRV